MKNFNNLEQFKSLSDRIKDFLPPPQLSEMAKQVIAIANSDILIQQSRNLLPPGVLQMMKDAERLKSPTINMVIDANSQIFGNKFVEQLNSIHYWGQIANISLYNDIQSFEEEELEILSQELSIEDLNANPIEIFNQVAIRIESYIKENTSIKLSSNFVIWIISTIIVPIILTKCLSNNNSTPQITNIVNNYYIDSGTNAKINQKISLRNHPRDKSQAMFSLQKNDEVKILKDSLKWCFVIKINTVESGWIRKEYLKLAK
jgi:hypothetical protein